MLLVGCGLLFVVCCLMLAVYYYLLFAVRRAVRVVCRLTFGLYYRVVSRLVSVACCLLFV